MIYTIGNCENYDKMLSKNCLFKSKGGSVWKNFSSVLEYFNNCKVYIEDKEVESSIYIVDGNWETDVIDINNNQGKLNKPCKIIKKL